ncbi:MAG: ankyrin repeat domain-containing protein [Acidobacteria bacterium]|nr:ankyrin repeat domain-containing protein [Acidobacteriota bacterium]
MRKQLILLFLLAVAVAGCGARSTETTPEMAQSLLKARGFNFTEDDFFKALKQSEAANVKLFLQAGMDPNVRNKTGDTALTFAVLNSTVETLKILSEKADLNLKDGAERTPLYAALKNERFENFDFLLEKGADPNSTGTVGKTKGQTVLYVAVLLNKPSTIKKLLDKGANPDQPDADGAVPISEHAMATRADLEVVKMLLEKTKNINVPESDGTTVLMFVAQNTKISRADLKEMIKLFLEKGADKSLKNKEGKTALDLAKKTQNKEAIELLQ